MAILKVPDRYRKGIVRTATLAQVDFDSLISALQRAPSCKDTRELLAWIGDETPSIAAGDRRSIIDAIVSMFRVQRGAKVAVPTFVRDVWDSIAETSPDLVRELDRQVFVERIGTLIEQSSLDLTSSRVDDARREVERSFCKVLVSTDLRPAFKGDLEISPQDMAVLYNFQIGFHDGMSKHKEFYVSLDGEDLGKLKQAIADAEKKVDTLERTLEAAGIRLHR